MLKAPVGDSLRSRRKMDAANLYLPSNQPRARWNRLDAAQILKRFFFCERAVIVSASSWIPHLAGLELKMAVPLFCWQNAETANALRHRVFELRFPNRLMEHEGADKPLADFLNLLRQAPSERAFVEALANVALPALRDAYLEFLACSDPLADAPTYRFLELSVREKDKQIADLHRRLAEMAADGVEAQTVSRQWVGDFADQLKMLGGIGTDRAPADRVNYAAARFTVLGHPRPAGSRSALLALPFLLAGYYRLRLSIWHRAAIAVALGSESPQRSLGG